MPPVITTIAPAARGYQRFSKVTVASILLSIVTWYTLENCQCLVEITNVAGKAGDEKVLVEVSGQNCRLQ